MPLEIAQSTPTAAAIARLVEGAYDRGPVRGAEFLRRSFNQVYRIDFASGEQAVARLCAERPRGGPNLDFEAQALAHWHRQGCRVSRCLPARGDRVAVEVDLPEGPRKLALFEYLSGEFTGETADNIQTFARGLADLHTAGARYTGVASAYTLDLDYLLLRPLQRLLRAPTMTPELAPQLERLAQRLQGRITAFGPLSRVLCHGDTHGKNNFIQTDAQGARQAVFFDFDGGGAGLPGV